MALPLPRFDDQYCRPVRIQQLHRLFEGASPHDLLLVQPGNKGALTPRSIGTVIRQARRELGTAVALAPLDLLTLDSTRWQGRFGISLQELT